MKLTKKLMLVTSLLFSLNVVPTAYAQETDLSEFEQVGANLYIHPDLKINDLDLTAIPYYAYGDISNSEIIDRVEDFYGQETQYHVEDNRAPYYQLKESGEIFQVEQSAPAYLDTNIIFYSSYLRLDPIYGSLTNWFIDFDTRYQGHLEMTNPEHSFASFDEAETEVKEFLEAVFNIIEVDFEMRSLTTVELQEHIDYENLNPLKEDGEPYTEVVKDVYFGKITPYIGDYPITPSNGTGSTDNISILDGNFVLSSKGFEHLILSYIPVGKELGTYTEVLSFEDMLELTFARHSDSDRDAQVQFKEFETKYIQDISVIYLPYEQESLNISGYFPVWQISMVTEDNPDIQIREYVNPIDGGVIN